MIAGVDPTAAAADRLSDGERVVEANGKRMADPYDFDKAFEQVDCIVGPVTPPPPFKLGEKIDDPLTLYLSDVYTAMANLTGLPAIIMKRITYVKYWFQVGGLSLAWKRTRDMLAMQR